MVVCDVTVIIPNFNRSGLLARALNSVRRQTLPPERVVVVDDCSSPSFSAQVERIVEQFRGSLDICLLLNEKNVGANASRNRGLAATTSRYAAFLDSDDLWMPNKLEVQMRRIHEASGVDVRPVLSGTGRYRVNENGEMIARQYGGGELDIDKIKRSNFIGTLSSVVVDASLARTVGGFDELLPACQDWDFFIRVAKNVQYVGVSEPLCIYVEHRGERITAGKSRRFEALNFMYRKYISPSGNQTVEYGKEMYRALAEESQQIGDYKNYNNFYSMYKAASGRRYLPIELRRKIWWCLAYTFGGVDLKAVRYRKYMSALNNIRSDKAYSATIADDDRVIKDLIAFDVGGELAL